MKPGTCQALEKREEREVLQMNGQERKGDLQVNNLQTGKQPQPPAKIENSLHRDHGEAPFYRESPCPGSQLA